MLTCKDIATPATDHLEERLPFGQRLGVRLHLALCRHCRTYVKQIAQTIQALRRLPEAAVPAEMRETLLASFRDWASAGTADLGRTDGDVS